jgi:hypothetical protein
MEKVCSGEGDFRTTSSLFSRARAGVQGPLTVPVRPSVTVIVSSVNWTSMVLASFLPAAAPCPWTVS